QVGAHCVPQENATLIHVGDPATQLVHRPLGDVTPQYLDMSALRADEAFDQGQDGRFAGPGEPDDRGRPMGGYGQVDTLQDLVLAVGELDPVEGQCEVALTAGQDSPFLRILIGFGGQGQDVVEALTCRHAGLKTAQTHGGQQQGCCQLKEVEQEGGEYGKVDLATGQPDTATDDDRQQCNLLAEVDHGKEKRAQFGGVDSGLGGSVGQLTEPLRGGGFVAVGLDRGECLQGIQKGLAQVADVVLEVEETPAQRGNDQNHTARRQGEGQESHHEQDPVQPRHDGYGADKGHHSHGKLHDSDVHNGFELETVGTQSGGEIPVPFLLDPVERESERVPHEAGTDRADQLF